ncbi:superoxide dismutase [Candidatus Thorarchaeota archaeon]|nr:MAG: superoxide dismutase [Candidatus Thorarchaeota archaeon]
MAFTVPKLKYNYDALEPYLSQDVVHYHYGKRTKKYFDTTNELIKGTMFEGSKTLDGLIAHKQLKKNTKLYHNAMQAYNHSLYWENLASHKISGSPSKELLTAIEQQWKSVDEMIEQFNNIANNHFSNGWCWLVLEQNKLAIVDTHDANQPTGKILLVVDLWEHSHEVQYPADRTKYLNNIWLIINWNVVNEKYDTAIKK